MPPDSYDVYYAGWSRVTTGITKIVGIHHPRGDIKKISFDNDAPTFINASSLVGSSSFYGWEISWDDGVTEEGSSGSPLFDQNGRIIGQLVGGTFGCPNLLVGGYNHYGAFSDSWSRSSSSDSRLQDWLDPVGTNPMTLNGIDGLDVVAVVVDLESSISVYPNPSETSFFITLPQSMSAKTIEVTMVSVLGKRAGIEVERKEGTRDISGMLILPVSHLSSGNYVINIRSGNVKFSKQVVVR